MVTLPIGFTQTMERTQLLQHQRTFGQSFPDSTHQLNGLKIINLGVVGIMDLKTKFLEAIKANVCFTCCALRLPEERHDAVEKVFLAAADLSWDYGAGNGVSREQAYTASEAAIDLVFQFVEVAPDKQSIIKVAHQMLWSYFWPEKPLIGDEPQGRISQMTLLTAMYGLKMFAMLTPTRRDDLAIDLIIKILQTEWEALQPIIDKAEAK